MKNELCISSLTKKKKKSQNLVVSEHRLYSNCLEQLLLHILSRSEKWGAYPGHCIDDCHLSSELLAAFPIPVYISVTDSATTHIERPQLQQCLSYSLSRRPIGSFPPAEIML